MHNNSPKQIPDVHVPALAGRREKLEGGRRFVMTLLNTSLALEVMGFRWFEGSPVGRIQA